MQAVTRLPRSPRYRVDRLLPGQDFHLHIGKMAFCQCVKNYRSSNKSIELSRCTVVHRTLKPKYVGSLILGFNISTHK